MDSVHNLSDELGLGFLVLAYTLRSGLSGRFLRSANFFNSFGLLVISGFFIWQAIERVAEPVYVLGIVPVVAGELGRREGATGTESRGRRDSHRLCPQPRRHAAVAGASARRGAHSGVSEFRVRPARRARPRSDHRHHHFARARRLASRAAVAEQRGLWRTSRLSPRARGRRSGNGSVRTDPRDIRVVGQFESPSFSPRQPSTPSRATTAKARPYVDYPHKWDPGSGLRLPTRPLRNPRRENFATRALGLRWICARRRGSGGTGRRTSLR